MPSGNTTTGSLADSQELIIDSARIVREFEGVHKRTCDMQNLQNNTGLSWEEISLSALTAQAVTETTVLDDPQALSDTLFTITPTLRGIQLIITDRVYLRLASKTIAKIGPLAQNAIERARDKDYLSTFAGATTTLSGTGTTLTHGVIAAGVSRITSNTTEPAMGPIHLVLHGFQLKDIQDEIVAGIGTYTIPNGWTEEIYKKGYRGFGQSYSANTWEDGNITVDSTPDARGGIHAQEAIVCVKGRKPYTKMRERPEIGGGAKEMFYYDEDAFGERSAGNWLFGILSDATAPTS